MALWDNIQGRWKLAGGVWTDTSGNGNTLTASASAPTQTTGHGTGANLAALFTSASSQQLTITDAAQTGLDITGSITIAGWLYPTRIGVTEVFVSKSPTSGNYSYSSYKNTADKIVFQLSNNGTSLSTVISTNAVTQNAYNHVVLVYDGTDMRIYINGSLDCTPTAYTAGINNSGADLAIGASNNGLYWDGRIDDVAIWSRALSSGEVTTLYGLGDDFPTVDIAVPKVNFNFTGKVPAVYNSGNNINIAVPKVDFNFTGKVPTVNILTNIAVAVPVAIFNFSRFAPTIRTTDVGIQPGAATFNFTGQAPTISVTGNSVITVPKATFNFTGYAPSVQLTNTEEEITWGLFDTNGNPITGAAPTVKIRSRATGYILDWSDSTFKAGGGTSPASIMQEMDATNFQGYYRKIFTMTGWADGWYVAATTYSAGTPKQNGSIEFKVQDGLVVDDYNSTNLDMAVSAVNTNVLTRLPTSSYTAPDNAGIVAIKAKTDNLPEGVQKNAALSNFTFNMVSSQDGRTAATGLTVIAKRSIDGGAFASCANSATEIGSGAYKINLAAADLNGDVICLLFTGSGAIDRIITILTNP